MIKLENVTKQYPTGNTALADVTFTIDKGEFVFLIGPSNQGKQRCSVCSSEILSRQPEQSTLAIGI